MTNNRGRCHPQRKPFAEWLGPRNLALRPLYWEISSDAYIGFKMWRQGMFQSAPMSKLVPGLKRACAGVETARRPCRYSEHRPNVGRVYILRKCQVRAMSPKKMERVTPLKTKVWKHMHIFILHTFYPTRPASTCHAVQFCPRTSSRRRMEVTTNSPAKERVEVVQLNCCYMTIN